MVYLPNIPAANDKPAQSQPEIQTNFTELNTQFSSEHIAFDAGADNGQHKFITLKRSAGVPPVGTNMILAQANTVAGNPYLQALNSTTIFSIPLVYTKSVAIPAGGGTINLFDFFALNFVSQAGTLLVYDVNTINKTILSPFVYIKSPLFGTLETPGTTGQLISGSDLIRFNSVGSMLTLETKSPYPGGATTVAVRVIGTAV